MNKEHRQRIFDKYGGKCAFCGYDLEKGWQVWDIEPIVTAISKDGEFVRIGDSYGNLLPACKSCASTRNYHSSGSKMDIEKFRHELTQSFHFLKEGSMSSAAYKKAIRYNLR